MFSYGRRSLALRLAQFWRKRKRIIARGELSRGQHTCDMAISQHEGGNEGERARDETK